MKTPGVYGRSGNVVSLILYSSIILVVSNINLSSGADNNNINNNTEIIKQSNNTAKTVTITTVASRTVDVSVSSEFVINTCCKLNFSQTGVQCKKASSTDKVGQPSAFWIAPPHLVAREMNTATKFPLKERKVNCQFGTSTVFLPLDPRKDSGNYFVGNGYLKVQNRFYAADQFCINGKNETSLEVSLCNQGCSGNRPCIKKCCSLDKIYSFGFTPGAEKKGCKIPQSQAYFKPTLYNDYFHQLTDKELNRLPAPHFIENYPSSFKYECQDNKTIFFVYPRVTEVILNTTMFQFNHATFRIRKDGKILYRNPDGECKVLDPDEHNACVDGVMNYGEDKAYVNSDEEMIMFLCPVPEPKDRSEMKSKLYGSLMLFSSIFLLLTIAVYGLLWEKQTVHGWSIVANTVSLLFMHIFLGTGHLMRVTMKEKVHNTFGCKFVGIATHFFFLSTFCWLSVISFDLWFTFRAITPRSGTRSKGLRRFIKYSCFGWGIPIIIVAVALVLDNTYSDGECSKILTPAYGKEACYLQERAFGAYIYLPIGIMLFFNFLFFGITTVKLYQYRQNTKMATKDDTQKQFYRLFIKLFFVMGIMWIFEVVSWATSGMIAFWYWIVFDIVNILRAIFVFLIFVCKPDIIHALEKKHNWLKPILIPFSYIFPRRQTTEAESVGLNSTRTKTSMVDRSISRKNTSTDT